MPEKDMKQAWDETWREGHLSSLGRENTAGPSPESLAGWTRFFESLPKGAKILDLCTGNGAVPLIAKTFSREHGKDFKIIGADQADIDPVSTVSSKAELLQGITFKGGVSAEDLPFPETSFDAVTGQYAIEYTDIDKTIAEVARVLSPKGRVRFVIHAREGAIFAANAPKVAQFGYILEQSGAIESLKEAVRCAMQFAESGDPADRDKVLRAREILRNRVLETKAKTAEMGPPEEAGEFLDGLIKGYLSWPNFKTPQEFEAWLKVGVEQAERLVLVLKSLADAAYSREEMETLRDRFSAGGFSDLEIGDIKFEGVHLHGWTLTGTLGG